MTLMPLKKLIVMSSPWPFTLQGFDLIGSMPIGRRQVKYTIIAKNYFSKWAEAKLLSTK